MQEPVISKFGEEAKDGPQNYNHDNKCIYLPADFVDLLALLFDFLLCSFPCSIRVVTASVKPPIAFCISITACKVKL